MERKKEKLFRTVGGITLFAMMTLNFIHAFNNYGILTNQMSSPILNQAYSNISTSSSSNKKGCSQETKENRVQSYFCSTGDKYSTCDYLVTTWYCSDGNEYRCKIGSRTSGHSCNTDYNNSSNLGNIEYQDCK